MLIEVTCSELRSAASNISKANESFRDAAKALQAAADTLMGIWEGDSRDKFESGMEQRRVWYEQMSEIVDNYVSSMNDMAAKYEDMDAQAAAAVKKG